jgi:hypothetical protein
MPKTGNSTKLHQLKAEMFAVDQLIYKIEHAIYQLGDKTTRKYATFNINYRAKLLEYNALTAHEKNEYSLKYMFSNLNRDAILHQLTTYRNNLNNVINCEILLSAFNAPTETRLMNIVDNMDLLILIAQHLDDPSFKENLKRLQYIDLYLYSNKPNNFYVDEASMLKASMLSCLLYHFDLLNNSHRESLEKIRYAKPENFEDCAEDMIELLEETLFASQKTLEKVTADNMSSHVTPLISKEHNLINTNTELKKYLELKQTQLENEDPKILNSFKVATETLLKKLISTTSGIINTESFKFKIETLLTCTTIIAQLQKDYLKYKKEDKKSISSIKNSVIQNINNSYCAMLTDPNVTLENILSSTNILLTTSVSLIPYNIGQFFGKENKLQTLILTTKHKIAAEKEKLALYTLKTIAEDQAKPDDSTKPTISVEAIHFNVTNSRRSTPQRNRDTEDLVVAPVKTIKIK